MLDQAESLRKLVSQEVHDTEFLAKEKMPKIFTVISTQHEVGKSSFTMNLSIAFKRKGKKVLILDSDIGIVNDDILMNFYKKCDESLDFIFINTAIKYDNKILEYIELSESLIFVTTSDSGDLIDSYSLLKLLKQYNIKRKINIVVKEVTNIREALNIFNKFKNTSKKFLGTNLNYLGFIMEDKKIIESIEKQKPFTISYPNSYASKCIENIANYLIEERRA